MLVADHARRDLPEEYGDLGLPASEFERHIAYDIGVEMVTRKLAALTGAPAVIANFSRLLIDPNRGEDDPTLIRQLYDGTVVPATIRWRRRSASAGSTASTGPITTRSARWSPRSRRPPARRRFIFSVHSFTPVMQGHVRPWHVGVLWDLDDRVARPLIDMLAEDATLIVGDNEPYDGALRGDTMSATPSSTASPMR